MAFFGTAVCLWAKRNHAAGRKAPPFHSPASAAQAQQLAIALLSLLRAHGPLPLAACWSHAQDAGFRSKRHMKLVLHWMKERRQVQVVCKHLPELAGLHGDKEFFYAAAADGFPSQR